MIDTLLTLIALLAALAGMLAGAGMILCLSFSNKNLDRKDGDSRD